LASKELLSEDHGSGCTPLRGGGVGQKITLTSYDCTPPCLFTHTLPHRFFAKALNLLTALAVAAPT
jgi:hypothetical protein